MHSNSTPKVFESGEADKSLSRRSVSPSVVCNLTTRKVFQNLYSQNSRVKNKKCDCSGSDWFPESLNLVIKSPVTGKVVGLVNRSSALMKETNGLKLPKRDWVDRS